MIIVHGRTKPFCPFCEQAKKMLDKAGLDFEYKDLTKDEWNIDTLREQLGVNFTTVPVVTVNGTFLGGAAELSKFIRQNSL